MNTMNRPPTLYILILLHLLLGISGVGGGLMMIVRPDGSLLQMQSGWLEGSPFGNYLIPGVLLFTFCGALPLVTAFGLLRKPSWSWANSLNIYRNTIHWPWAFSLYTGITVITWILAQMLLTRYFILQPIIILVGLKIIAYTLLPRIMEYYSITELKR